MSGTPSATPTGSPGAPRKPLGCGKRVTKEAADESPAKKFCVEEEKTYKTFDAWVVDEGVDAVYNNVKDRFNEAFGVKVFAELYEGDDTITSWEAYDKGVRENGCDETDTLINVMDDMVKQIRDQDALIEVLRKRISELEKS